MQDQDILDRNPGLATLITDLNTRFLTPTGTSLHLDQDLHQARYALKHKKSYLETKTLFEPIDRLRFLPLDNYNNLPVDDTSAAAADLQRDIQKLFNTLYQTVTTLWEIIVEFKTRYQVEQDQALKEYFEQLVESLNLKL
ncbi:hypothetical protein BGZ97_005189, partial [Linnemannia gamsii]